MDTFETGSVSLTMVSVLGINKASKERQGPTLGVHFTELFVLYIEVSIERELTVLPKRILVHSPFKVI